MRLSGIGGGSNSFNLEAVNQKINRNKSLKEQQSNSAMQLGNRDSVFISKRGKQNSMIQQLMDQKQLIQECKDAEMQRGLEHGYVNQEKIDEYDKQLELLDKKIAEAATKQSVNGEDKKDTGQKDNGDIVLTREEYEKKKFTDMMNLSSSLEESDIILSVREKMDGEASVLKAQIKSDGGRVSESKLERIAQIEEKSAQLLEGAGEKISHINNEMSDSKEAVHKDDEKDEKENLYNIQTSAEGTQPAEFDKWPNN